MWPLVLLVGLAFAVSCDHLVDPLHPDGSVRLAPDAAPLQAVGPAAIPDRYVVVLKPNAASPRGLARDMVGPAGGRVHHVYEHGLKGFSMTLPRPALNGIRNHPMVAYVAEDAMAYPVTPTGAGTQPDATWGLDRIDQRDLPLDGTYGYGASGAGVTAYVIDSGILPDHEEFTGRASIGADFIDDGQNGIDCNGHGTHVAGTIGGATYGVAKAVELVAVRVFSCEGGTPYSVVIAAVDWVTANAALPAVANMSLGGGVFDAMDDAVRASVASGVTYVLAAGNSYGDDACHYSPARTAEALTVGSTTSADERSEFSNAGTCVDLFAPGSAITSAWHTGTTDTRTISGTSMAAPHVAGVAALYLEGNPAASPATVGQTILGTATAGRLADIGQGSPDLLVFSPLTPPASGPLIGLQPASLRLTIFVDAAGSAHAGVSRDGASSLEVRSGGRPAAKGLTAGMVGALDGPGATGTGSHTVRLSNLGNETLNWTATADASWLGVNPTGGSLAAHDGTDLLVTIDAAGLGVGTHHGTVAIADPAAANSPRAVDVTLVVAAIVELESGIPVPDLSGTAGSQQFFRIRVPEGTGMLAVQTFDGTGDLDLFVRYGDLPELENGLVDCVSAGWDNDEFCVFSSPPAGDWYIMLYGWAEYEGATLVATVGDGAPVIDLWPAHLQFQVLSDPTTGALITAAPPAAVPDREALRAPRTLAGGKSYSRIRDDGTALATLAPPQWLSLGNVGSAPLNWTAASNRPWLEVEPASGVLEPLWWTDITATVNAAGLALGDYQGAIEVADPAAINSPQITSVRLSVIPVNLLEFDVPATGLSGDWGSYHYFRVTVPDGLDALDIRTSGGTGDLDMFVRYGSPPDLYWWNLDCASLNWGTEERCLMPGPAGGDWYILLYGWQPFDDVTLVATVGVPAPIIELSHEWLFFQQLSDPVTGGPVAAAAPVSTRTREQLEGARTLDGGKTYRAVGMADASPASFYPEQPVWLWNSGAATLNWMATSDRSWLAVAPPAGALEQWEAAELTVSVDAAGLPTGWHFGTLTVADPAAMNSPRHVGTELNVSLLRLLELDVPHENLSGDWNTGLQYFRFTVPVGATDLEIRTFSGTGDLDLFVRYGSPPDLYWWEFDCASGNWGNDESCSFPEPPAGDWYIMVYPSEPFDGATLVATATVPADSWTLELLAAEVRTLQADGVLDRGPATALIAPLDAAIAARDRGDTAAARGSLRAFITEVRALERSRRLDAAIAGHLIQAAQDVTGGLGG